MIRHIRIAYECPKCKHSDHPYIMRANAPRSLMNHSLASPSAVAYAIYQKYVNAVPLYRQEKDRSPQSKSYMWVYRTGNDGKAPIVLFAYEPSRSGDNAVRYLQDFKGYVHSDGYSGYNKLTDVVRCGCWAHLRRKFVEAIPNGKATRSGDSAAEKGRSYCDELFRIEDSLRDLSPEDRHTKRLELERPVLDAFLVVA